MKDLFGAAALIFIPLILIALAFVLITYLTDNVEGIASVGILLSAVAALFFSKGEILTNKYTIFIFIAVFAALGLIFDRAGNAVYNVPIAMLCPAETILKREVVAEENHEGEMVNQQYFSCYSKEQEGKMKQLPLYQTIGIRFLEYIIIGSVLIGVSWVFLTFVIPKIKH